MRTYRPPAGMTAGRLRHELRRLVRDRGPDGAREVNRLTLRGARRAEALARRFDDDPGAWGTVVEVTTRDGETGHAAFTLGTTLPGSVLGGGDALGLEV